MGKLKHETILLGCWFTLMLATLGTVYWGTHATTLTLQVTVILLLALLKSAVIIDGFMELWHAERKWRVLMYGWPVVMSLVIAVTLLTR